MAIPHRLLCVLSLLIGLYLAPVAAARPTVHRAGEPPTSDPGGIRVGSLQLLPCRDAPAYCGNLVRPLDSAAQVAGTIAIHFEYYPRRQRSEPALGTIVAVEGGPGYPSTGSRGGYLGLFGPLLDHRDLLLVDNRGTGHSQVIDCEPLQTQDVQTQKNLALCGASLGQTSDLYGSGAAADDLAAVLDALAVGTIDLYGDSYGTFFSQTFAARHPDRLRSVVLDSAYPVIGESPWYVEDAPAMRNAFNVVCQRSPHCAALGGSSIARIERLLDAIRLAPIAGTAFDGDGQLRHVQVDPGSLAYLMFANATSRVVYRELDAAARAYLDRNDSAPILRLVAENRLVGDARDPSAEARYYSRGLFAAVSCSDYPQLYDMTAPPSVRHQQRDAAFALQQQSDPTVYAPFTIREFNRQPLDYSVLDLCLNWPVPSEAHPPAQPVPPGARFTPAPVLELSGELDSLTAPADGLAAANLFENGQQVLVANSFHVTAVGDLDNCASKLVRNFVANLDPGDTSCAAQIAEVRTVPDFVTAVAQVQPASALPGNRATAADRRIAAAAVLAAGDAFSRWWVNLSGSGVGLRGGSFRYGLAQRHLYRFWLDNLRWVDDEAVSGSLDWNFATGQITAHLSVLTPAGASGTIDVSWQDRQPQAQASLSGTIAGRTLQATMPAP
ncbi:alpha/beta fold hydrolase [Gloeobacter kilaueensis]|uniref:TAP domain-containing protein n=1 Tax=Gloeobacter kilaueensis (strain ATCC BAA-2537 / CCAP 1431/1 / ULC 316 / JS1) TaxID=1183438 RepID=U5QS33_GLOK1|nr:alpha/beta hydrolase [Gloeobacter kilaueensis]AGY60505.1 TAP domain-containing protein [Gloeobacter kilaueensis JS1]